MRDGNSSPEFGAQLVCGEGGRLDLLSMKLLMIGINIAMNRIKWGGIPRSLT
jgi:hypothetical protein